MQGFNIVGIQFKRAGKIYDFLYQNIHLRIGDKVLVETLADEIAEMSLANRRVQTARVRIEKLDIFENASSVGVEIERDSQV